MPPGSLMIPAPLLAVLPLTVVPWSVRVAPTRLSIPPPVFAALLSLTVLCFSVSVAPT